MPGTSFNAFDREQSIRNKTKGSLERFVRAQKSLAGGVSSGLRRTARPYPLYFTAGLGSRVADVDGNSYLDYGLAWGPLILGHAPQEVIKAVAAQLGRGFTFGAQHDLEFETAEIITSVVPCADLVCFANSGTEIVQLALRLARAATQRSKFLKFEGHYHGWADNVLVSYHPAPAEIEAAKGAPIPVGVGQRSHDDVLIASWNDRPSVEQLFATHSAEISAVICEPMLCNGGCIPPEPGFLEFLRDITRQHGALLIFDEVITGFRLHLSGAQGCYGVTPDLATYAKAIGAGIAVSVLAGKSEWMDLVACGKVVHAGTLNGNPLALAAAKATLEVLSRDHGAIYEGLSKRGERLRTGLETLLRARGHGIVTAGFGAVFQLSFMEKPARNYRETLAANKSLYSDFALALLDEGILVLPDGRWYLSAAHSDEDIESTLAAAERAAC
ncbi:MAG TPA: aspartate aminotransferase family protein [Terriglobia bacterium]|nr:aspartate aminotransferase family protein [Terriglobia bacterium]